MDQKTHDKGLEIRKAVLGEAYVNNALKNADSFNKPFQELVTEYCWRAVWGREELPHKERMDCVVASLPCTNASRLSQAMTEQEETTPWKSDSSVLGRWASRWPAA